MRRKSQTSAWRRSISSTMITSETSGQAYSLPPSEREAAAAGMAEGAEAAAAGDAEAAVSEAAMSEVAEAAA